MSYLFPIFPAAAIGYIVYSVLSFAGDILATLPV